MAKVMSDQFVTKKQIIDMIQSYNERSGSYSFLCYENQYSSDVYENTPSVLGVTRRIVFDNLHEKITIVVEEPRCNFYKADGIITNPDGQGICENIRYRRINLGNPAYCPKSNVYICLAIGDLGS